jgi:hypothetical protein
LGIPTTMGCFLITSNFYASMTFLFLIYLLSEGWISPAISMIQQIISNEIKGIAISVFLFTTTISGMLSTVLVGVLEDNLVPGVDNDY